MQQSNNIQEQLQFYGIFHSGRTVRALKYKSI